MPDKTTKERKAMFKKPSDFQIPFSSYIHIKQCFVNQRAYQQKKEKQNDA